MHWTLYDLPPEMSDEDSAAQDAPDAAELDTTPDFPTLTDCPYCGSRNPERCGCFADEETGGPEMTLTEQQQRRRDNMRHFRKVAADNLRTARTLQRRGDARGTEFLEKYHRARTEWGVRNPNPDRRADLLKWVSQLEETLSMTDEGRAERRANFTAEQWQEGEKLLQTLRDGIADTYAIAAAARY